MSNIRGHAFRKSAWHDARINRRICGTRAISFPMPNEYPGMEGHAKFAPQAGDSIRELRWKAESMLEFLRENEVFLRKSPAGSIEQRLATWQSYCDLVARAMEEGGLADDARLEAHRVWAEEVRYSALNVLVMYSHTQSDAARERFADDPEALEELIERLERARPAALNVLSTEDRDRLREEGLLKPGE